MQADSEREYGGQLLTKDVKNLVEFCQSCELINVDQPPEPLQPDVLPDKLSQQIGID